MTKLHTIELESVILFFVAALVGVTFAWYAKSPQVKKSFSLPVMNVFLTPTPTQTPLPKSDIFSQLSPDGNKKITMTVTPVKTTKTYVFQVSNVDGTSKQTVYSINLPNSESMSIPFNTFSPDNVYALVQHNIGARSEAIVMRADGAPLTTDAPYDNIAQIFTARQLGNTYQIATGWASNTLVIVNTTTPDGNKMSYWFEVPSKAIIPLATQF